MHDIETICALEADVLPKESQHIKHNVGDVGAEVNRTRVKRIMDFAVGIVREALYPMTKYNVESEELTDWMKPDYVYELGLTLPDGFSETTFQLMAKAAHEFIVKYVVSRWLMIVYPQKATVYKDDADEMLAEVKRLALARGTVLHRGISPLF